MLEKSARNKWTRHAIDRDRPDRPRSIALIVTAIDRRAVSSIDGWSITNERTKFNQDKDSTIIVFRILVEWKSFRTKSGPSSGKKIEELWADGWWISIASTRAISVDRFWSEWIKSRARWGWRILSWRGYRSVRWKRRGNIVSPSSFSLLFCSPSLLCYTTDRWKNFELSRII